MRRVAGVPAHLLVMDLGIILLLPLILVVIHVSGEITDGTLSQLNYEPERTETRKQTAQDRFDRLSSRPPDDDGSD